MDTLTIAAGTSASIGAKGATVAAMAGCFGARHGVVMTAEEEKKMMSLIADLLSAGNEGE